MAKLKAPLFSLGASGSIAKTLVYFPWKGLNAVREHVVPTNPDTQAQKDQRGYMRAAVTEYHDSLYLEADMTAWARLAGAQGLIMTGFNRMVKEFIDEAVDGNAWERIEHVWFTDLAPTTMSVMMGKAIGGNAPTVRWGVRKTYLPNPVVATDEGDGSWKGALTGLTTETLYYITIDVGTSGADFGRVGIYMQRTLAT